MIKILSWNICNKKTTLLQDTLLELASGQVDIIVLQEAFGQFVNTTLDSTFEEISYPGNGLRKFVRVFLKKNTFYPSAVLTLPNNKLVFVPLKKIGGTEEFNLAAIHLYSKVNKTERQQFWRNLPLVDKINEFEKSSSNNNTIVVGDFNYNPYETDLCDPSMIGSKDSKDLITTFTDYPVSKKDFNFWYNPMWNLLGDHDFKTGKTRTTGTYFRYTEDEKPMWNMFDGFILRPSIMDKVDYNESSVLTSTATTEFLKPFIIRSDESMIKEDLSDHLPIEFTLNIN